ncbi:MAG: hypothetical protein F6K17_40450, partial [Okeania sp. SIO3C4]|nr:hypothetical protein [Okeania sp. SIO3C4]
MTVKRRKILGTGKYQERANIRNGQISGTGKMPIPQNKTIKIPSAFKQRQKKANMTDKPTDYAAILRAGGSQLPLPPEWLKIGAKIYSPKYGIG